MRFKAVVAYDGTDYYGWQSQVGGNTIQDKIESSLSTILKKPTRIHGSGRTDSGVHARGQVFHFDADWKHSMDRLHNAMQTLLPPSIQICSIKTVSEKFHARYSAKRKKYTYYVYRGYANPFIERYCVSWGTRILQLLPMQKAAATLLGQHDFSAFSALRSDDSEESPVKNLLSLDVVESGPMVKIIAVADGFLYKMVRSLAGALLDVGCGKLSWDALQSILDSRQRTALVVTAPAKGLFLEKVYYY